MNQILSLGKQKEPQKATGDMGHEVVHQRAEQSCNFITGADKASSVLGHKLIDNCSASCLKDGQTLLPNFEEDRTEAVKQGAPHDEEQDLNLLALADLQTLVKPKFSFKGDDARPCNLFTCLIRNTASEEREALAHESPVLIPSRSSFFMADISNFRMLLKGKHDT